MIYDNIKSLIPQQYKDAPNFNKLLEVLSSPFDELKIVFEQIEYLLDIDLSTGHQLDLIGEIVVQKRNAMNDADYRKALKIKILKNSSTGFVGNIVSIMKFITSATRVVYADNPPAAYTIYTNGQIIPDNLGQELEKISAAGVSVIVYAIGDGSKPIVLEDQVNEYVNFAVNDDLGNIVTDNNLEPVFASFPSSFTSQILAVNDDGTVILNEDGSLQADESFIAPQNNQTNQLSNYDVFDGVKFGYLDNDDITIIAQGKLPTVFYQQENQ